MLQFSKTRARAFDAVVFDVPTGPGFGRDVKNRLLFGELAGSVANCARLRLEFASKPNGNDHALRGLMKILAIDQGTTTTKAFILEDDGALRLVGRLAHRQFCPAAGVVEHDAEELASNIESLIDKALDQEGNIAGIALANQGETVVAWDRRTKKPLHPAIVWQDQRTQPILNRSPDAHAYIRERTGLPTDAYFSASKLSWLLKNVPEVAEAARTGSLGLATSDSFLLTV